MDVKDGKQVIFRRKSHMTDMREVRMSGKNIQLYVCTSLFLLSVSISLVITSGDLPRSNPIAVLSHWRTVQSQEISRLSPVCLLSCHSTKSLENLASDTGTNTVLGEKKKKKWKHPPFLHIIPILISIKRQMPNSRAPHQEYQ